MPLKRQINKDTSEFYFPPIGQEIARITLSAHLYHMFKSGEDAVVEYEFVASPTSNLNALQLKIFGCIATIWPHFGSIIISGDKEITATYNFIIDSFHCKACNPQVKFMKSDYNGTDTIY